MVKLINKVKILHATYDLKERTSPSEILDYNSYGNHIPLSRRIEYIQSEKSEDTVDTLIHEMLHAIYGMFGLTQKDTEDEIVSRLALGLTTIMKDNKKFFQQLLDML